VRPRRLIGTLAIDRRQRVLQLTGRRGITRPGGYADNFLRVAFKGQPHLLRLSLVADERPQRIAFDGQAALFSLGAHLPQDVAIFFVHICLEPAFRHSEMRSCRKRSIRALVSSAMTRHWGSSTHVPPHRQAELMCGFSTMVLVHALSWAQVRFVVAEVWT
jgi:hypothetical protein